MPTYSYDGFSKHLPVWEEHIYQNIKWYNDVKDPSYLLDIGAGEGAASLWMLNKLCGNLYSRVYSCDVWAQKETEKVFNKNIAENESSHKVVKMKGNIHHSLKELAITMQTGTLEKFGFINVNCTTISNEAAPIILDAFSFLKENGYMVINNIDTKHKITTLGGISVHYTELISFFTRLQAGRIEIIHGSMPDHKQLIFKKIALHNLY